MSNENLILNEGLKLAEGKFADYTESIMEGYQKRTGKEAPVNVLASTAMLLENVDNYINRMDETTKVVNLGNFVDYGLGIVSALMPSLIAQDIVSVQPLQGRTGEVWFLNFQYTNNKGNIKAGTSMFDAKTGPNGNTHYSDEVIEGEMLGNGDNSATSLTFYANYTPVKPGSIEITFDGGKITDDGRGKLSYAGGTKTVNGTVNYETGKIDITTNIAAADSDDFVASYEFDMLSGTNTLPEVDLTLKSEPIQARPRKLRAKWLFDAAFELQKVHGVDADVELTIALASEIRHEIDGEIMNDLFAKAGITGYTWSKTAPDGVAYRDHKDTFVDLLTAMSNDIFAKTKRATGNFIIAGMGVCNIIESMSSTGQFVPATTDVSTGPHFIGTLAGKYKVYKNPYYANENFLVGYKGSSYLEGGYVYAPFLPLYTTPTIQTDDFLSRKGVATQYGKKMINNNFYATGKITN